MAWWDTVQDTAEKVWDFGRPRLPGENLYNLAQGIDPGSIRPGFPGANIFSLFQGGDGGQELDKAPDRPQQPLGEQPGILGDLLGSVGDRMQENAFEDHLNRLRRGLGDTPGVSNLRRAQEQARAAADRLDEQYEQDKEELRGLYATDPTPEEKAMLQDRLADLEARRAAGEKAIKRSYGQGMRQSRATAKEMRGQAAERGADVGQVYSDAAQDIGQMTGEVGDEFADFGLGLTGGDVGPNAQSFQAMTAAAGPREAAYTENVFNLGAQDVQALGQELAGERGAQQADLRRLAMQMAADAQNQWNSQIMNRVSEDRRAQAAAIQALMGDRSSQQAALGREARGYEGNLADMLFDAGAPIREQVMGQSAAQLEEDISGVPDVFGGSGGGGGDFSAFLQRFAKKEGRSFDPNEVATLKELFDLFGGNIEAVEDYLTMTSAPAAEGLG